MRLKLLGQLVADVGRAAAAADLVLGLDHHLDVVRLDFGLCLGVAQGSANDRVAAARVPCAEGEYEDQEEADEAADHDDQRIRGERDHPSTVTPRSSANPS